MGLYLADMQLISKHNKGIRYLCEIDFISKYVWVVPLKAKKWLVLLMYLKEIIQFKKKNKQNMG